MEWLFRGIGGFIAIAFLVAGLGYLFSPYQVDGIKGIPPVPGKLDCGSGFSALTNQDDPLLMPEECKDKGRARAVRGLIYLGIAAFIFWLAYNEEPASERREQPRTTAAPGATSEPPTPPPSLGVQEPPVTTGPAHGQANASDAGAAAGAAPIAGEPQKFGPPRMKSQFLNDAIGWLERNKVPVPVKNLTDWVAVLSLAFGMFEYLT